MFEDEAKPVDVEKDSINYKEMHLDSWRNASPFMIKRAMSTGNPYHIRIKLPREYGILCQDTLRGELSFPWYKQYDRVIMKSNGLPTYHFASVIDDHLMNITHVLRGEEWLSSLPIHQFLYEVFNWEPPKFTHLSVILNPNGKGKMSKRKSAEMGLDVPVFVSEHKERGFLPEALNNFMLLTGWNPGKDKEFMRREEMIDLFDPTRFSKTSAAWNYKKLLFFNQRYISDLSPERFAKLAMEFV